MWRSGGWKADELDEAHCARRRNLGENRDGDFFLSFWRRTTPLSIPRLGSDVWVAMALGEKQRAEKIIDALPNAHPFEVRYTQVEKIDWESCREVLDAEEKVRILSAGW